MSEFAGIMLFFVCLLLIEDLVALMVTGGILIVCVMYIQQIAELMSVLLFLGVGFMVCLIIKDKLFPQVQNTELDYENE